VFDELVDDDHDDGEREPEAPDSRVDVWQRHGGLAHGHTEVDVTHTEHALAQQPAVHQYTCNSVIH